MLLQTTLEQWKLTTNDSKDSSTKKLWLWRKEAKDVRFEHGFYFVRSWLTERWNLILRLYESDVKRRESIKSFLLVFQWFLQIAIRRKSWRRNNCKRWVIAYFWYNLNPRFSCLWKYQNCLKREEQL